MFSKSEPARPELSLQQQQQSGIVHFPLNLAVSRHNGEKAASSLSGSHLSFSQVLSGEIEKQRRVRYLKEKPEEEMSKIQALFRS